MCIRDRCARDQAEGLLDLRGLLADEALYGEVPVISRAAGGGVLCRHRPSRWWPQPPLCHADGCLNPAAIVSASADLMKVMGALIAFEDGLQPLANLTGPSVADSLNVAELGGGCRHQGLQVTEVVDDPLDCA